VTLVITVGEITLVAGLLGLTAMVDMPALSAFF
jgi:hypothetical protein